MIATADSTPARMKAALIASLDPSGEVASVFVSELQAALPWMKKDAAKKTAADILFRRRGEQRAHEKDAPLLPLTPGLPEGKDTEMVDWLAQPKHGEKPGADALIHIYANLHAQQDLHHALATKIFRESGPLEQALAKSLQRYQPTVPKTDIKKTARDFIAVRRMRAEEVTEALRPGGAIETQAIELATNLRRQSDADVVKRAAPHALPHDKDVLGKDIAFGIQQTIACWATDFIDPYVSKWFQDKFKSQHHHGTLAHTWGGEIVGDTTAFFSFLAVRKFFPQAIDWIRHGAETLGAGFYERSGKKSLRSWAQDHHLHEDSPEYQKKLAEWKHFQSDNFAKSSVITIGSIVFNVMTQKAMGNTHTLPVITGSKLTGAAITMAGMLGLRFVAPDATRALDDELNQRYFNPLIHKTQKLFGVTPDDAEKKNVGKHTKRLSDARETQPQISAA